MSLVVGGILVFLLFMIFSIMMPEFNRLIYDNIVPLLGANDLGSTVFKMMPLAFVILILGVIASYATGKK